MFAKSCILIFAVFWLSSEACNPNENCDLNIQDEDIKALLNGIDVFTNNLMNLLFTDTESVGNVSFSPMSVYTALSLIAFGSKGPTHTEIITALGYPQIDIQKIKTSLASILNVLQVLRTETIRSQEIAFLELDLGEGIALQKNYLLVEAYQQLLDLLGGKECAVDFTENARGATSEINKWISNQTGKRCPFTLTVDLDASIRFFLATTAYFSGKWENNLFNKADSIEGKFRTSQGEVQTVMMRSVRTFLHYADPKLGYSAVQLGYQGGDYVLMIVLPNGDVNAADFVKTFNTQEYRVIIEKSQKIAVDVQVPMFVNVWSASISKHLKAMQINQLFAGADLADMIQELKEPVKLADIYHAIGFEMNEAGTTVTYAPFKITQPSQPTVENPQPFIVQQPFIMLVRHIQTNAIVLASFVREI